MESYTDYTMWSTQRSVPGRPPGQSCRKGTTFQHSQNFARRSITPPCQNRGPAKDERKTVRIRPRVGGQRRRRQQPGDTSAGCWPTASRSSRTWGAGPPGTWPGLNRLKAALVQPGDCVKVAALDRLGRSLTEVLELLGWLRENQRRNHQPPGVHRPGQRHRPGDAALGHRLRGDGTPPGP